ncbi:hypothetical protein OG625_37550 [Streptomyces sp. NBC_01351]|nr:hypothetical protein [Streptomyces sp. NBC_01351]
MHRRERLTPGLGAAAVLPATPIAPAGGATPGEVAGLGRFGQGAGAVV